MLLYSRISRLITAYVVFEMRMDQVCCSIMSVTLLYSSSVAVQAIEQAVSSRDTKTILHQNDKDIGRNSKSLSDVIIPESLAPSPYLQEQIQAFEQPRRPELPDGALRPERPEKPAKPIKPEKPVKPETGRR